MMLKINFEKESHLEPDSGALAPAPSAVEMFSVIQNLCMGMTDLTWTFLRSEATAGGLRKPFRTS